MITDADALREQLADFWKKERLPKSGVRLVVDSGQFLTRIINAPKLKPDRMMALVTRELSDSGREGDVVDYMEMPARDGEAAPPVFCCSAQRGFLKSYIDLFAQLKVKISTISPALSCCVKLIEAVPAFWSETVIWLNFDGSTMLGVLIDGGRYKYSSRSRLFDDRGTPAFGSAVAGTVSGLIQFQTTDRNSVGRVNAVYFSGCQQEDLDACRREMEALGLWSGFLEEQSFFHFKQEGVYIKDFAVPAGDYIRR